MNQSIEKEIKVSVEDVASLLNTIRRYAHYKQTLYIRDVIYGISTPPEEQKDSKLRLRIQDNGSFQKIHVERKKKLGVYQGVRHEQDKLLYAGSSYEDALREIAAHGEFREENSYEK